MGFPGGSAVKNPETRVRALGGKDPLQKKMAILSNTLAWELPWTEEPGGLQFMESQESNAA